MKTKLTGSSYTSYHAYLLKIWLEQESKMTASAWRFSLEDIHSGSRRGFTDLESLWVYLQNLTGAQHRDFE